ncbi:MAG: tRNA pseudouridine(38-40) synthase TruA [Bacillus sp. (in: Bacteria)]|nr:tRNA pseudouridine(38-40) synthase TruA [Bacillus sp. (in: firmicutes)]
MNYKLNIQYDGSRYKGWQRLGNTENTIQGKIEHVLSEMIGEKIEIIGSSRTDAGVHALEQVANFHTKARLSEAKIKSYLNHYLPQDISIAHVSEAPERFHARYNTKAKTYLYKIWNKDYLNPFLRKHTMHVNKPLNITEMRKASSHFIGEHDFTAFTNAKSKKKSNVRIIYSIDIEENEGLIEIRVNGNGFLYNMVRKMVGTLIGVGLGDITQASIPDILASKQRNQTGDRIAEPYGLYLEKVEF